MPSIVHGLPDRRQVVVAVPLVTSLLTLFPFMLLSFVLIRERAYVLAAFMLVFPVTLSPELGMITSMPRGFVTGVFLSSFAVLPLFYDRSIFLILSPFFAILALFANPNSLLVLLPAILLIGWRFRMDRRFYLLGAAGALPAAIIYYLSRRFYDLRPGYRVHPDLDLSFNIANIRWSDLQFLDDLSPILWGKGYLVPLFIILIIAWFVLNRKWSLGVALFGGLLLLIISFGLKKVHDGTPNVFFPWARMFLAVPFLIALFVSQLKVRNSLLVFGCMPLLAAGFFSYKCATLGIAVERQVDPRIDTKVEMARVSDIEKHCQLIQKAAVSNRSNMLVVSWGKYKHLTNYGCPCLVANFPVTIEPALDRRTWLLKDIASTVPENVLITGMVEEHFDVLDHHAPEVRRVSMSPLLFLVKDNREDLQPLLKGLGLELRPL